MIIDRIQELADFQQLCRAVQEGTPPEQVGLAQSTRLAVAASLIKSTQRPVLYLTGRTDRALVVEEELDFWLPETKKVIFPEPDPLYYEDIPWSPKTRRDRLSVLADLAASKIPGIESPPGTEVIIAPIRAAITRTLPRREFLKAICQIKSGQRASLPKTAASWYAKGYQSSSIVVSPGEFARRGGILDIWPPGDRFPARLEFFGDEIEMIRRFDPGTQRTIEHIDHLLITPAKEFLLPETGEQENPEEYSEYHLPLLESQIATLMNYLPDQMLILGEDRLVLEETVLAVEAQASSLREVHLEDQTLPEHYPLPYQPWETFREELSRRSVVYLGPVSGSSESGLPANFKPNPRFGGELKSFLAHLVELGEKEIDPVVVSRQAPRLKEIWLERSPGRRNVRFIKSTLQAGWVLQDPEVRDLALLTDSEIFGWGRVQPRKKPIQRAKPPEGDYSDFSPGEWVVHIDHGIGRFQGLVQRELEGAAGEYLAVEYAEGDRLFVPAAQADRLAKYVGPDQSAPQINRLGSTRWASVKSRIREEVQEVAADLLKLYARREKAVGYAFAEDTIWQQELEASFPYIETDDQLRVLNQVKRDMERPKPMDRLICGDVGYGKTEIAVRAAFKAVMDGKQTAVLVPTTVLAQQHFDTFSERMGAFPVEVRMLSRFRTPRQQAEILREMRAGSVDIVIGTHRLLSSDIRFHDLGLLIVDEEQRFGVAHKEKIKKLRANIDVLTLTATPIPRTMYMALTGVRDISRLETPPEERLPVVTHVGRYDPQLVTKAIWRELERGGQVFFVHNRVRTITAVKKHLSRLIPEARIAIAHGQMPEKELAERMRQFARDEVDVLLSTSIIESGLDIPNANTLIVDRADMFGLAQLHQLRGRVGRGAQRAYAYFFQQRSSSPTLEGRLRLETIAEYTQLGAGYSVAMRDLEIRGAGEILGTRQSGHIAAVGFHLYTRLLANAVEQMKEGKREEERTLDFHPYRPPIQIDLPLPSGIPVSYIEDQTIRLSLYRRMAEIERLEEIDRLRGEFKDRFGLIPQAVENLFFQLRIKILAEKVGLESVSLQYDQLVLSYPEEAPLPQRWELDPGVRFGESSLWLNFNLEGPEWRDRLIAVMESLVYEGY
ncbi:MAG: transcription-repair coupling factor [Anaerolineales bacterium]|nr:transcription-repair coupling factor [Anaerolineales bacterium]